MISAVEKDIPDILHILTPAFADNKSVNRCVKQDGKRLQRIENQIRYVSRISIRNNMAFLNTSKNGAILCSLSNGRKANLPDDLYYISRVSGLKLGLQLVQREKHLKKILPESNYCHLWFIGVEKGSQGKGTGSEMLNELKKLCAEKNLPIYLETSNERNLKFYEKNGFTLYHSCILPTDDFKLYFFEWKPA